MKAIFFSVSILIFVQVSVGQKRVNSAEDKSPKIFPLGVVDEIRSQILGEQRVLNIYLPEGYSDKDTVRYPVVYLLDGSADEDFIHVTGIYQFSSFEWVARAPKSIIVGIANVDRRRDFTFPTTDEQQKKDYPTTGHSQKFIDFIGNELQPFIQKKYLTNGYRTIIGESLGGLLTTEILFKHPSLFDQYIIVSPSIWWDNGSILNLNSDSLKNSLKEKTKVFIAVGQEGLTPTVVPRVMEVDAHLLAEKLKEIKNANLDVYLDYLPGEDHGTIMHQAVYDALRWLSKPGC